MPRKKSKKTILKVVACQYLEPMNDLSNSNLPLCECTKRGFRLTPFNSVCEICLYQKDNSEGLTYEDLFTAEFNGETDLEDITFKLEEIEDLFVEEEIILDDEEDDEDEDEDEEEEDEEDLEEVGPIIGLEKKKKKEDEVPEVEFEEGVEDEEEVVDDFDNMDYLDDDEDEEFLGVEDDGAHGDFDGDDDEKGEVDPAAPKKTAPKRTRAKRAVPSKTKVEWDESLNIVAVEEADNGIAYIIESLDTLVTAIKEKDERLKRKKKSFKDLVEISSTFKEKEFITLPVDVSKELQLILAKEAKIMKYLVEVKYVKN